MAFSPDDVRRATDEVLSSSDYQTDLPIADETVEGTVEPQGNEREPETTTWSRGSHRNRSDEPIPSQSDRAVSGFSSILLLVVGLVAFALLALWVFSSIQAKTRDAETTKEQTHHQDNAEQKGQAVPADAESLAKQGLYGEAIHALLLNAMAQLQEQQPTIRKSSTSREVLRSVHLGGTAKQALGNLIQAVELAHFGGRATDSATFHSCTRHYWDFHEGSQAGMA